MKPLISPTQKAIIGTYETVPGTALATVTLDEHGVIHVAHEGETKIHWDAQEPEQALGQRVLVDEDGELWLEGECQRATQAS